MAEPNYSDLLTVDTSDDDVTPDAPAEEVVAAAPSEPEKPEEPAEPAHRNSANERIQDLIRQRDEERAERQQRQMEADRLREEIAALRQKIESPVLPEPEPPSFMEDPEGNINSKVAALQKEIQALERKAEAGNQAAVQAAEEAKQRLMQQQFVTTVSNAERDFYAKTPDYYQALEHLRNIQRAEMTEAGLTPEAINEAITKSELQTAITSMSNGKNPAEFAYARAKIYGYKPATAETPATKAAAKIDLEEQAEMAARRAAAGTIGGSGTGDENGMDDAEAQSWAPFERAFKEMFGKDLH